MEDLTISQVSKQYDVTPRMLRHYEKLGLIETLHREDYAYRMYDENAVRRLQQIIILRKLRIPLKQIAVILQDNEQLHALRIMQENIAALDEEIDSLDKIRGILKAFAGRLEQSIHCKVRLDLLNDPGLIEAAKALSLPKTTLKESADMSELNKAEEVLNKSLNVRIVLLPPFTVAAFHYIGETPEEHVGDEADRFIRESRLYEIKPDSRMFGFNHPNPGMREDGFYGYGVRVTIPEDMEVPDNCTKKQFSGGLFAAYTIRFPEFQYWGELENWVRNSPDYDLNYSEQGFEVMGGCLEEHLNWVYCIHAGRKDSGLDGQLDLLMPVKKRT